MNMRLENSFAQLNVTSDINHAHFRPSIQIEIQRQIIWLVEQTQIMMSLYTSSGNIRCNKSLNCLLLMAVCHDKKRGNDSLIDFLQKIYLFLFHHILTCLTTS